MTKTVFPTLSFVETKPIGGGSGIDDKKIYLLLFAEGFKSLISFNSYLKSRIFFLSFRLSSVTKTRNDFQANSSEAFTSFCVSRVDYTLPVSLRCVKWVHKAFILQLSNWRFLLASSSVVSHVVDRFPLLVFWSRTKMAAKATQN